ncbi:MAG TPA: hypothetical protein VM782_04865 [Stellaceae bacterium]|nr:hypothetical protein [Stellaceae bacterium]
MSAGGVAAAAGVGGFIAATVEPTGGVAAGLAAVGFPAVIPDTGAATARMVLAAWAGPLFWIGLDGGRVIATTGRIGAAAGRGAAWASFAGVGCFVAAVGFLTVGLAVDAASFLVGCCVTGFFAMV